MRWSEDELKAHLEGSKPTKYHAKRPTAYGRTWDSAKELKEYEKLLLLQKAGAIKTIEIQPIFVLQPSYKRGGKTIRAMKYIADFRLVLSDGKEIVIDVKGFKTPVYELKKKLLLYKYPDIDFREVY